MSDQLAVMLRSPERMTRRQMYPKVRAWRCLARAMMALRRGNIAQARLYLIQYRWIYDTRPASTKRRWRCGR